MRYLNGGAPAYRAEITTLDLPAFLSYYSRFPSYGFWAALDRERAGSWAGSISARSRSTRWTNPSWARADSLPPPSP